MNNFLPDLNMAVKFLFLLGAAWQWCSQITCSGAWGSICGARNRTLVSHKWGKCSNYYFRGDSWQCLGILYPRKLLNHFESVPHNEYLGVGDYNFKSLTIFKILMILIWTLQGRSYTIPILWKTKLRLRWNSPYNDS